MKSLAAESGMDMTIEGELPRLDDLVEQALYGMTVEALTKRRASLAGTLGPDGTASGKGPGRRNRA